MHASRRQLIKTGPIIFSVTNRNSVRGCVRRSSGPLQSHLPFSPTPPAAFQKLWTKVSRFQERPVQTRRCHRRSSVCDTFQLVGSPSSMMRTPNGRDRYQVRIRSVTDFGLWLCKPIIKAGGVDVGMID